MQPIVIAPKNLKRNCSEECCTVKKSVKSQTIPKNTIFAIPDLLYLNHRYIPTIEKHVSNAMVWNSFNWSTVPRSNTNAGEFIASRHQQINICDKLERAEDALQSLKIKKTNGF